MNPEAITLNDLKNYFNRFKNNPHARLMVNIGRKRAGELRKLLSEEAPIDQAKFRDEVWKGLSRASFNNKDITNKIRKIRQKNLSQDEVVEIQNAFESGQLEIHGNFYLWQNPDAGPPQPSVEKALNILRRAEIGPTEKANKILEENIGSFGPKITTGLVMLFHPTDYLIYDKKDFKTIDIFKKLNNGKKLPLEDFQAIAKSLRRKEALDAEDFIEMYWFFYFLNNDFLTPVEQLNEIKQNNATTGLVKMRPEIELLGRKKQIILYGPPGTGKTFSTRNLALDLLGSNDFTWEQYREKGNLEFITFHPAYTYEEFIEGITVHTPGEDKPTDNPQYKLKSGLFKILCKRALGEATGLLATEVDKKSWKEIYDCYQAKKNDNIFEDSAKYVLIIDEINRGDIAKIFGELITLLEADKRLGEPNELVATLPCSRDPFGIPPNLYIIGTMNTADRSIALLDVALRRRFGFVEMPPDFEALRREHLDKMRNSLGEGCYDLLKTSIQAIEKINLKICDDKSIGRDRQIGHSFLFTVKTIKDLALMWKHDIFPLLEEYCYSNYAKINYMLFKSTNTKWINESMGIRDIENVEDMKNMLKEILNDG
jgi:DNA polymerase III delta prime subunit